MLKNIFIKPITLICLFVFIVACSKDEEPEQIHEEELITRVTLSVKKEGSSDAMSYTWNDGDEAAVDVALDANSTYKVEVSFYNASDPSDVEDITEEVREEADDHLVFYEFIEIEGVTIAAASDDTKDSSDNSVLLKTVWTTTSASSGKVRVYLIHKPTSKTGTTRNDFGGETDVEVDFHVDVE